MKLRTFLGCSVALLAAVVPLSSALAQEFPNRPVKVVVGYAPEIGRAYV